MMDKREASLIKVVGKVVREYTSAAVAGLAEVVNRLDQRIKEIPAGPRGEKGDKGDGGSPGEQGARGETGIGGKTGDRGEKGDKGDSGEPGQSIQGDKGDPGGSGERGEPGERGEKGDRGETGQPGTPGLSTKGDTGDRGERGEKGESGAAVKGDKGDVGEKGLDGKDGRDGRDGIAKDGRDGEPGRDALQLEILPAIDLSKSYPRGTWAQHEGGIWRAVTNTTPSAFINRLEWDVAVRGLSRAHITQGDDPRCIAIELCLTGEELTITRLQMPVLIYRDVYRDGVEYVKGDVVTWGGSAWHCAVETTRAKPGAAPTDWKLMVKEGRVGKNGERGPEGPHGKDGRDGRDLTQLGFDGSKH